MYSLVFLKNLYETIRIQNFEEDNQECVHLFSEKFSIKQCTEKNLKKIVKNVFICFLEEPLPNNTYPKFWRR